MPTNILMPALSPTMEKGNLAKWLKKEGDAVKSGDVLAEIETDKATMEVEAVDEGVLAKIVVPDGTADVPVNQVIAILAGDGEDAASVGSSAGAEAAPRQPPASRSQHGEAATADTKGKAEPPPEQTSYARLDQAPATADTPAAPSRENDPARPPTSDGERVFASPLARRIANEGGLDLAGIQGSGPRGRIVHADVQAALAGGASTPKRAATADAGAPQTAASKPSSETAPVSPAAAPPAAAKPPAPTTGPGLDQVKAMYEPGSYEEVALDGMRRTVAKRLSESKQTVPHFYMSLDVELDALLALREQVNAGAPKGQDGQPAFKLSVNDFVIKALALALQRVPDANVVWAEDRLLRFKHSDVGVAVAVEGGLFTPLIRKAELKTLSAISAEMKDLAGRARRKRLKPEEYQGGSTAVSNLGMYGVKVFQAIVNPPHATILAVGAGEKRVVVRDDAPAVVQAMTVTLSVDHRAVDGALGAEVLAAFKSLIEHPLTMLV